MFGAKDSELASQNKPLWQCYLGRWSSCTTGFIIMFYYYSSLRARCLPSVFHQVQWYPRPCSIGMREVRKPLLNEPSRPGKRSHRYCSKYDWICCSGRVFFDNPFNIEIFVLQSIWKWGHMIQKRRFGMMSLCPLWRPPKRIFRWSMTTCWTLWGKERLTNGWALRSQTYSKVSLRTNHDVI